MLREWRRTLHKLTLAVSIVLNAAALVLLKATALRAFPAGASSLSLEVLLDVVLDPAFLLAVFFFVLGVAFWIHCLRRLDLSLAYPAASLSYVFVAVIGMVLFNEEVTVGRWVGITIIVLGVYVMFSKGKPQWR